MKKYDLPQAKDLGNGWVIRTGLIFKAGDYPDKAFSMTPEELKEAEAAFKPADLDIEHRSSIFDGKLGKLEYITAEGDALYGAARIPKWLHEISQDTPIKVSCTWDRATKKLSKLALVTDPRVSDAALMAAFAKDQLESGVPSDKILIDFMATFASAKSGERTWVGQDILQEIHNLTSKSGAVCSKTDVEYVSKPENKAIQEMHDIAVSNGATCYVWDANGDAKYTKGSEQSEGDSKMTLKERIAEAIAKLLPEDSASVVPAEEVKETAEHSAEATRIAQLEAQLAEYTAKLEALDNKEKETATSKQIAELEAKAAELAKTACEKEAELFANELLDAGKILPTEVDFAKTLFVQLNSDDAQPVMAEFSGKAESANRVSMLKALFDARTSVVVKDLTEEKVEDAVVLSNEDKDDNNVDVVEMARKQVEAYLKGNKAI